MRRDGRDGRSSETKSSIEHREIIANFEFRIAELPITYN